jgi:hypothetical protein
MRLGITLLRWASPRADRPVLSYEDHSLLMQNARELELRERGYAVSAFRIM